MYRLIFTTASLATLAFARTDLTGCTSTDVSSPAGTSIAWYVPGTGELCDFLDCGGGRAPPKTTVPGCPQYSGTATYSPSYLPGYGAMETGSAAQGVSQSASAAQTTSTSALYHVSASETGEPTFYAQTSGTEITTTSTMNASSPSSDGTTLITSPATVSASQVPAVDGGASNATTSIVAGSSNGARNGTVTSGTPSQHTGSAMETARVWVGGVAIIGLGAVVAAL